MSMPLRSLVPLFLLAALATRAPAAVVEYRYDADSPPEQLAGWGVSRKANSSGTLADGVLHVVDEGTEQGELHWISHPWNAHAEFPHRVEARVKVGACSGPAGVILMAADGEREAGLTLYPDRVELHRLAITAPVTLSDDFHVVRLEMQNDDLRVFVDDELLLDLTDRWDWPAHEGRNIVGFGSLSSPATGEAWWDWVGYRLDYPDVEPWPDAEHTIVYREPDVYACFPSLHRLPDGTLLTTFGTRTRRSHIDNAGGSTARVSRDGGRTWTQPEALPAQRDVRYLRADGSRASAGAVGWRYAPAEQRAELEARGLEVRDVREGTVGYASGAHSALHAADGTAIRDWTPIDMPPHRLIMAYNQAAYLNAGNGLRLVAIYGIDPDGLRHTYILRSEDDGEIWTSNLLAAGTADTGFNETALARNADGDIIALMRTEPSRRNRGYLYQSVSTDGGRTWSEPVNTGIWGYPADIVNLPDGRLLAMYGYRRPPMGIRGVISSDGGKTWDLENEIVLRADGWGNGSDLGYPLTQVLDDGTLLTLYYFNDRENVTHIVSTRWRPPAAR